MSFLKSFGILSRYRLPAAVLAALSSVVLQASDANAVRLIFDPPVAVGDIEEFEISPDGTQVAFVGSLNEDGMSPGNTMDQAWVATISGPQPTNGYPAVKINPEGVGDVDGGIAWTPDGMNVVIRYEEDINDPALENELYLVPADGSQVATMLTTDNAGAFDQQVSSDGNSLFFSDGKELFVTSFPGPGQPPQPTTLLNPTVTGPFGDPPVMVEFDRSEIDTGSYAQVGSDIVYSGFNPPVLGAVNATPENAFYRTAADGSTAATPTLIPVLNTNADTDIDLMQVTPDGQTIIFNGDLTVDGRNDLYSLPITGGVATPLLPPNADPDLQANAFTISPDGMTIAFRGDLNTNGVFELYVIPIGGGTPIVVNDPLQTAGSDVGNGVDKIAFSPDSRFIYYQADAVTDGTFELFRVANPIPEPSAFFLVLTAGLGFLRTRGYRGAK